MIDFDLFVSEVVDVDEEDEEDSVIDSELEVVEVGGVFGVFSFSREILRLGLSRTMRGIELFSRDSEELFEGGLTLRCVCVSRERGEVTVDG